MKNKIEQYVGKTASIEVNGLKVQVNIKDVKNTYGRDRYLVSPVKGSGEVWVEHLKLVNLDK